ncbi:hypothetical protein ACVWY3_004869 [Bradyrhizobium sp. USDA 4486]
MQNSCSATAYISQFRMPRPTNIYLRQNVTWLVYGEK